VSGIILQMFHVSMWGQNQNILLLSQIYLYFCHIEIHFKFNLPEKNIVYMFVLYDSSIVHRFCLLNNYIMCYLQSKSIARKFAHSHIAHLRLSCLYKWML